MKGFLRILALFFAVFFLLPGCGKETPTDQGNDTLVVGTMSFDGKFSPFFYVSTYDREILDLVHLYLLETDREGSVVTRGIQGETRPYGGKDYTYKGIAGAVCLQPLNGQAVEGGGAVIGGV